MAVNNLEKISMYILPKTKKRIGSIAFATRTYVNTLISISLTWKQMI